MVKTDQLCASTHKEKIISKVLLKMAHPFEVVCHSTDADTSTSCKFLFHSVQCSVISFDGNVGIKPVDTKVGI